MNDTTCIPTGDPHGPTNSWIFDPPLTPYTPFTPYGPFTPIQPTVPTSYTDPAVLARLDALEARIATLEGRIAQLEAERNIPNGKG